VTHHLHFWPGVSRTAFRVAVGTEAQAVPDRKYLGQSSTATIAPPP
jgi:hypothetical protein